MEVRHLVSVTWLEKEGAPRALTDRVKAMVGGSEKRGTFPRTSDVLKSLAAANMHAEAEWLMKAVARPSHYEAADGTVFQCWPWEDTYRVVEMGKGKWRGARFMHLRLGREMHGVTWREERGGITICYYSFPRDSHVAACSTVAAYSAMAVCSFKDAYSYEIGRRISYGRLIAYADWPIMEEVGFCALVWAKTPAIMRDVMQMTAAKLMQRRCAREHVEWEGFYNRKTGELFS